MIRYVFGINPDKTTNRTIYGGKLTVNARIYRGAPGESGAGIQTVNSVSPDGNGNVPLTAANIPETSTRFWLTDVLKAAYDGAVTALNALLLTGQRLITSGEITKLSNTSGTNTGDQTITLTGDVTGSGTGTFAATIADDAVTFAKMQNISQDHLIGRHSTGNGDPQLIGLDGGVEFQGGKLKAKVDKSVVLSGGNIELSGDTASPGNSKYYGTNGSGAKGFFDLPSGGDLFPFESTPILITGTTAVTAVRIYPIPTNIGNCGLRITAMMRPTAFTAGSNIHRFGIGTIASPTAAELTASTNIGQSQIFGALTTHGSMQRTFSIVGGSSGSIKYKTADNQAFDFIATGTYSELAVNWTVQHYIYEIITLGNAANAVESFGRCIEKI
jgi:hypothetical protein